MVQASKKITEKRLFIVIRPCEENERRAHSEKNVRCGHTGGKKKRTAKPTMERCMQERRRLTSNVYFYVIFQSDSPYKCGLVQTLLDGRPGLPLTAPDIDFLASPSRRP